MTACIIDSPSPLCILVPNRCSYALIKGLASLKSLLSRSRILLNNQTNEPETTCTNPIPWISSCFLYILQLATCCFSEFSNFPFVFHMGSLDKSVPEKLAPPLGATAEQPPLFDGTTKFVFSISFFPFRVVFDWQYIVRILFLKLAVVLCLRLYTCYMCPFAQRVWITRNFKVSFAFHHHHLQLYQGCLFFC